MGQLLKDATGGYAIVVLAQSRLCSTKATSDLIEHGCEPVERRYVSWSIC